MDFTTPPSTPPSTPKKLKCPWAPLKKKVYGERLFITNDGQRVKIFPFIESNNDTINSCRRRLFVENPSKIPTLIKKVKASSKFADSLKRKIKESRRR
jgi:hypothetical protein